MIQFNVYYDNKLIHTNLTHEEVSDVLIDISEEYYSDNSTIDPSKIEIKEINHDDEKE